MPYALGTTVGQFKDEIERIGGKRPTLVTYRGQILADEKPMIAEYAARRGLFFALMSPPDAPWYEGGLLEEPLSYKDISGKMHRLRDNYVPDKTTVKGLRIGIYLSTGNIPTQVIHHGRVLGDDELLTREHADPNNPLIITFVAKDSPEAARIINEIWAQPAR